MDGLSFCQSSLPLRTWLKICSTSQLKCYIAAGDPLISGYDKVFEGEVSCGNLEEVYQMFNINHPDGYRGRSLSVSDVVEVVSEGKSTFYFCDSIGFKEIAFDPDLTETLKEEKIKVVLCEPGKLAKSATIEASLESYQKTVGGYIEAYYPVEEPVCIVLHQLAAGGA